jgi:hypothetical protein
MIKYSSRARVAYARLFSPYNDIDVFVEDSTYVGVYERLINKVLSGKAHVTRVTPLGPRSEVEQRARLDTGQNPRPRLYIVDGDLDLLAFGRQERIEKLYRLKVYSLENLLLEASALEDYCGFAAPSMQNGACAAAVNVAGLIDDINRILLPYIVSLAIARRLNLRGAVYAINPPSVALSVGGRVIGPCPVAVRARVAGVVQAIIRSVGLSKYRAAKAAVLTNLRRKRLDGMKAAPGKLFALPYLNHRVEAAGGMGVNQRMISSYLADKVMLRNDPQFAAVIRRAIR